MRKQILLFFLFSIFVAQSKAQRYNVRTIHNASALNYSTCKLLGDTLYVVGNLFPNESNSYQRATLNKFHVSSAFVGQSLNAKDTTFDFFTNTKNCILLGNQIVSVGSGGLGSTPKGILYSANLSLDKIDFVLFEDTNRVSIFFYQIILGGDSCFYITGTSQDKNYNIQLMVLKIKIDGTIIWRKYYPSYDLFPTSLNQLGNGKLQIASLRAKHYPFDNDFTIAKHWLYITEIDTSNGAISFVTQLTSDSITGSVSMIKTSDKGYIIGADAIDSVERNFIANHGYIGKLDSNYSIVWKKKIVSSYGNSHFNTIKQLADGNYLGIGECVNFDSDTTIPFSNPLKSLYAGWLVKFNEAGDILWDRKYYGVTSYQEFNRLFDFAELPNGDIIACGESTNMYNDDNFTQDSILQMGWLLRIGPDGCLSGTNCGYTSIAVPQENKTIELSIYPNPAVDKINIETHALDDTENYSFVVTDLTGKAITNPVRLFQHSSYIVNAANYSSGSYIVSVFHHQQLLFSKKIEKL